MSNYADKYAQNHGYKDSLSMLKNAKEQLEDCSNIGKLISLHISTEIIRALDIIDESQLSVGECK